MVDVTYTLNVRFPIHNTRAPTIDTWTKQRTCVREMGQWLDSDTVWRPWVQYFSYFHENLANIVNYHILFSQLNQRFLNTRQCTFSDSWRAENSPGSFNWNFRWRSQHEFWPYTTMKSWQLEFWYLLYIVHNYFRMRYDQTQNGRRLQNTRHTTVFQWKFSDRLCLHKPC